MKEVLKCSHALPTLASLLVSHMVFTEITCLLVLLLGE